MPYLLFSVSTFIRIFLNQFFGIAPMHAKPINPDRRLSLLLSAFLAVGILVWQFFPTVFSLHLRWAVLNEAYGHGYVVVALCAYCFWRYLTLCPPSAVNSTGLNLKSRFFGMCVFLIGLLGWMFADASFTQLLAQLALPIMFSGWVICVHGLEAFRRVCIIPLLMFSFALPVWDFLVGPLRLVTTDVTAFVLSTLGITFYVSNFQFYFPSGIVRVAGGCSGLNFFTAALLIGFCYSEWVLEGKKRIVSVVLACLFAVVANWLRVISLMLLAHYSEMTHPLIYNHGFYGWVVFAVMLLLYFYMMHNFFGGEHKSSKPNTHEPKNISYMVGAVIPTRVEMYSMVLLCLVLMSLVWGFHTLSERQKMKAIELQVPQYFQKYALRRSDWMPLYSGYDMAQHWVVRVEGNPRLTVLTYLMQQQKKELVYFSNRLGGEYKETTLTPSYSDVGISLGRSIINTKDGKRLIYWAYHVGDRYTIHPIVAKFYQTLSALAGKSSSELIAVSYDCSEGCRSTVDGPQGSARAQQAFEIINSLKWQVN